MRVPKELRDAARSAARRKASDVSVVTDQGTAGVAPGKAAGHAVVAAALGMTDEFQILLDIAKESSMPAGMLDALEGFSQS